MVATKEKRSRRFSVCLSLLLTLSCTAVGIRAQQSANPAAAPKVLAGAELARLIPASFYFEGQSAPVQARNSAAVRLPGDRHVFAGLVDTSGYAAPTRAKCQGFFTAELPVMINGTEIRAGSYGLGLNDGKVNLYDLGGNLIASATATSDAKMRRPRPLTMINAPDGVRLYLGRDYVVISAK